MSHSTRSAHYWTATGAGLLSLVLYHLLMRNFFPNPMLMVGHDYSYFLARLLDGYFWWRQNGFFSIPWFTPSFLGGIPFFPNPQSMYHSIPQALSLVMDPLSAVYATVLIFAAMGFFGFYIMLAGPFRLGPAPCALGAFIFMFNGFYMSRMIVGHFAFHCFMLTGWIIFFILSGLGDSEKSRWPLVIRDSAAAGILLAYMASSGGLALAQVMVTSILAGALIHAMAHGGLRGTILRFILSGVFSLGLSAGKLLSGAAFLAQFTRDDISPVARDFMSAIYIILSALFLPTDGKVELSLLVNRKFFVALHEFDFAISPVPFFLAVVGLYIAGKKLMDAKARQSLPAGAYMAAMVVFLIFLVPLALNFHSDTITSLANSVPLLKNATRRLRWIAVYIPPMIIISVMTLDSFRIGARWKYAACALLAMASIASASVRDWDYYLQQGYDPAPVARGWKQAMEGASPFRIDAIGVLMDKQGAPITRPHSAVPTLFVMGVSPMYAYEPIFGYKQHKLPPGDLAAGPAMAQAGGHLNLRNPACFLYPEENGCAPGDLFKTDSQDRAEAFRSYKPFPFSMPWRQKIANALSIIFIPITALALLAPAAARLTARGDSGG